MRRLRHLPLPGTCAAKSKHPGLSPRASACHYPALSTIDPVQARQARAEHLVGSPRALAQLWGVGILLFGLGAGLGFGVIAERNSGRQMALGIRDWDAEPWINEAW